MTTGMFCFTSTKEVDVFLMSTLPLVAINSRVGRRGGVEWLFLVSESRWRRVAYGQVVPLQDGRHDRPGDRPGSARRRCSQEHPEGGLLVRPGGLQGRLDSDMVIKWLVRNAGASATTARDRAQSAPGQAMVALGAVRAASLGSGTRCVFWSLWSRRS